MTYVANVFEVLLVLCSTISTLNGWRCGISPKDRVDCDWKQFGFGNLNYRQCMAVGCCWAKSTKSCYQSKLRPNVERCGETIVDSNNSTRHKRIAWGDEAKAGEFPWMVWVGNCGGALIEPDIVLSAAHCFKRGGSGRRVKAGTANRRLGSDHQQLRTVAESVLNKGYNRSDRALPLGWVVHDLVVLKLDRPFNITDHVRPICKPDFALLPDLEHCFMAGFGRTRGTAPQTLLYKLQISEFSNFNKWPVMFGRGHNAEGNFSVASHGDSGSPLACRINGTWYDVGHLSITRSKKGQRSQQGIVTTNMWRAWIDKTIDRLDK